MSKQSLAGVTGKSIIAHTLVKNEENYLWFAVNSVISYVDRILLWDTGSTDNTVKIISEIKKRHPEKIDFKEVGNVTLEEFPKLRQKMLDESNCDWILVVDGDEVWWEEKISELVEIINNKGDGLDSVVSGYYSCVGDIYHYQDEKAGRYKIDDSAGHISIRAINRRIPGLSVKKPYGQEGFYDGNGKLVQERKPKRRLFSQGKSYLHFTHLARTSGRNFDARVPMRSQKLKFELGKSFPLDFYYPEAFFQPRSKIVQSAWKTMNRNLFLRAVIETPLRKLKRKYGFQK